MKFVMRSEAGKDIAYDLNRAEGRSRIAWIAELVKGLNVGALIVLSAAVKREEINRGIGEYAGKFGGDAETAKALKEWHESEAKRLEVGASDREDFKPCKCGATPKAMFIAGLWDIECECGALWTEVADTKDEAIEWWNHRVEAPNAE